MQAKLKAILIIILCFLIITSLYAQAAPDAQTNKQPGIVRIDFFLSSTCPYCQKADKFFSNLAEKEQWLDIHRHIINQNRAALDTFYQMLQEQNANDFSVPTVFFCDSRWVGFAEDSGTQAALLRGLTYCHQQLIANGRLTGSAKEFLQQAASAYGLTQSIIDKPSVLTFLPLTALAEALGACAIFCVIALFACVCLCQKSTWRIGCGFVFLAAVSLAHYIQQVHTAFFYQGLFGWRVLAVFTGLGLLFFIFKAFLKDLNTKKMYFFIILIALTGFVLQSYQQTCTPNFGLIFEQWLNSQQFSSVTQRFFRIIYQGIYITPLGLLVLVMALGKRKRLAKYQPLLTRFSWISLGIIAILLVIYPYYLASMSGSFAVLPVSLGIAWFIKPRPL